jgi:hypothetical protein
MSKLQSGHECVPSDFSCEIECLQILSVTLILEVMTLFLDMTCCLHVVDIFAGVLDGAHHQIVVDISADLF